MSRSFGPTIAQALSFPHNAFTLLRLLLALAVVLSHAGSVVTGAVTDEPLYAQTRFTLGEHAVNGFFAISGFLVTMSFDHRGWRDYVLARSLRIAPGLIVAVLVVALALGLAMTRLPSADYLASPALWRFITATLTTFKSTLPLPGVFEDNPLQFPMGTVWTLKYEVLCYAGVLAGGVLGLLRRRGLVLGLVAGLAIALLVLEIRSPELPKGTETALRLPLIFVAGAAAYLWRDRLRLSGAVCLAWLVAAGLLVGLPGYRSVLFLGSAYLFLWLALAPAVTRRLPDPKADLSYGTYLYGWPIQQAFHTLFPTAGAVALLAPSLASTLAVAAASWYLVEKPALALKARAIGRRTLKAVEPAAP